MANILKNSGSRLEKKKRTRLPLSVWLAFLMLVTLTVGSTLARYNTSVSGDTTARVAKFQMTTAADSNNVQTVRLDAGSGDSGTYQFTITNDSEVAVRYSVIVKNVPANVEVSLDGVKKTSTGKTTPMKFDYKELNIGAVDTCTLTFCALESAAIEKVTASVQVYTEQVD